ncbi:MAG: STAS domain-containing protein [Planctomycetaceae bacterium]|nr:STAS domain-containing protein [Planctomycetaceae bacterium]
MYSRSKQGRVDVVSGDLPLTAELRDDVWQLLEECLEHGQPRIVVDLKRVPLIDSTGLELLLDMRDACQERGGSLTLAEPNPLCQDILSVTGVGEEFEIWSDVVEAAGRFAL